MRLFADLILAHDANPPPPQPHMLTKMSIYFRDMDGTARHILGEFYAASDSDREKPYHDQAENFFKSRCPGAAVRRNANHNGGKPDLVVTMPGWVGGSLIVEIKVRLKTRSARDRLVGQVVEYQKGGHQVLVLLCGPVSARHVQDVTERLNGVAPSALAEGSIVIVDRTVGGLVEARKEEERRVQSHKRAIVLLKEMRQKERAAAAARPPPPSGSPADPG